MLPPLHILNKNVSARLQAQPHILSLTSALKELCQNSIDSKATMINILYDPSNGNIICKDNGLGIEHDSMEKLGTQNYMTSKIVELNDLINLQTYGFKGTALYSIVQLAKCVYIASKCPGYNSTWVTSLSNDKENSRILSEGWCPDEFDSNKFFTLSPWTLTEQGTVVVVCDLLFHVPVRRQMMLDEPMFKQFHQLKSHLFQILIKYPNVNIVIDYLHKGKIKNIINYSSLSIERDHPQFYMKLVRNVFNPIIPNNIMKRVTIQFKQLKLNGIMSVFPLKSKDLQFIFINGWKYYDPAFIKIINSYFISVGWPKNTTYQAMGKTVRWYPFFILDIQSSPQTIDEMLQDPEKTIMRPHLESLLQNLILKVVKSFLKLQGYHVSNTITIPSSKFRESKSLSLSPNLSSLSPDLGVNKTKHTQSNDDSYILLQRVNEMISKKRKLSQFPLKTQDKQHIKVGNNCWLDVKRINQDELNILNYTVEKPHLINGEVISQVDRKFILTKFDENKSTTLLILDQHACDERIKLEAFLQNYINDIINKTLLLKQVTKPCEIQLNENEFELFTHYKEEFDAWGIRYLLHNTESTKSFLQITALSEILFEKCHGNNSLLREIMIQHIEDLKAFKKNSIKRRFSSVSKNHSWHKFINNIPSFLMDFFNSKACRTAIMFGDILTKPECEFLIHNLTKCFLPFQCAHGRPSVIPLTVINQTQSIDTPADYLLD
ncbi:DNA mismatch repair protein Mlh3p [Monosporozyma servazzii]